VNLAAAAEPGTAHSVTRGAGRIVVAGVVRARRSGKGRGRPGAAGGSPEWVPGALLYDGAGKRNVRLPEPPDGASQI